MAFFAPVTNTEKRLQVVAMFLATGMSFYSMWAVFGPWQWIMQAQVALFGGYEGSVTFLATTLVYWVPMAGAIRFFAGAKPTPVTDIPAPFAPKSSEVWNKLDTWGKWSYRWILCTLPGQAILLGLTFLIFTTVGMVRYREMRHHSEIDIAQLESGATPDSLWLSVTGIPIADASVGIRHYGDNIFIPIASSESPQSPIAACAKMRDYEYVDGLVRKQRRWDGVVDEDGLPALARSEYTKMNLQVADGCLVIDLAQTPEKTLSKLHGGMVIGFILLGVGSILLAALLIHDAYRANK